MNQPHLSDVRDLLTRKDTPMNDPTKKTGAVWYRIAQRQPEDAASLSASNLWLWRPNLVELDGGNPAVLRQLRASHWVSIPAAHPERIFCLLGQLLPLRSVRRAEGDAEPWAKEPDLEAVKATPVALGFALPANVAVGGTEEMIAVEQALPPAQIGEVGFVFAGSRVICYSVETLGEEGYSIWRLLSDELRDLEYAGSAEDWSHPRPRLQELARRLAELYWTSHRGRALSTARSMSAGGQSLFSNQTSVPVPVALPLQAVFAAVSNAASGADGWVQQLDQPPQYRYVRPEGTAIVKLGTGGNRRPLDPRTITNLWEKVRRFDDVDNDVLLIALAQAMCGEQDAEGFVWLWASQILETRGIQPITKRDGSTVRPVGHRTEDLTRTSERVERLLHTRVTVRMSPEETPRSDGRRRYKRRYTEEAPLLQLGRVIRQHETETDLNSSPESAVTQSLSIAWQYRPGPWILPYIDGPNRQFAWLCQQALRYDPHNQVWEKRLARYLLFNLRINTAGGSGTIILKIGTLITELSLQLNKRDPEKTRQRFERAMGTLQEDGIIEVWGYPETNPLLPARNWQPLWLEWDIFVSVAPLDTGAVDLEAGQRRRRQLRLPRPGESSILERRS